jgi:hypothetical protein
MRDSIRDSLNEAFQEGLFLYLCELLTELDAKGMHFSHFIEAVASLADARSYPDTIVNALEKIALDIEAEEKKRKSFCCSSESEPSCLECKERLSVSDNASGKNLINMMRSELLVPSTVGAMGQEDVAV